MISELGFGAKITSSAISFGQLRASHLLSAANTNLLANEVRLQHPGTPLPTVLANRILPASVATRINRWRSCIGQEGWWGKAPSQLTKFRNILNPPNIKAGKLSVSFQ